uniref:Cytochrome c oxidase subunit 7B, mitochondrial n=1 Tax=Astatotilapia calliptera TaxID=8154 RepID=A0AAX7VYH2_ASTCA
MYRFGKAAVNISVINMRTVSSCHVGQAMRQVRHGSNLPQNFHSKYGAGVLVSGAIFCTAVWGYVLTSTGITWNLSPVGKIQPKPWREE